MLLCACAFNDTYICELYDVSLNAQIYVQNMSNAQASILQLSLITVHHELN